MDFEMFFRNPETDTKSSLAASCFCLMVSSVIVDSLSHRCCLDVWSLRLTCWILDGLLKQLEVPNNGIIIITFLFH